MHLYFQNNFGVANAVEAAIQFPKFMDSKFTEFAMRFLLSQADNSGFAISQSGQVPDLHELLNFINLHSSDENIIICAPSLSQYQQIPLEVLYQESKFRTDISVLVIEYSPLVQYYEVVANISSNNPNVFKIFFFK